MDAEALVRAGEIREAVDVVQERIRSDPADTAPRILLFQLLSIQGDWDRALLQLKTLGELDAALLPLAWSYRSAIRAEVFREKVFRGERTPPILGEPARWTALLLEALRLTATGRSEEGSSLRGEAFEAAPAIRGTIDGETFAWIADSDSRIGPMLELVVEGRYGWAPFGSVADIFLEEPTDLRDLVWAPITVRWVNGGESMALMPVRYPFSHTRDGTALALSRKTVWEPCGGSEFYLGYGQRMWVTDQSEHAMLETRHVTLGQRDG